MLYPVIAQDDDDSIDGALKVEVRVLQELGYKVSFAD